MATVDATIGGTTRLPAANMGSLAKLVKQLDFSSTNRDSADVIQLFDIPAGTLVLAAILQVDTAEGGTATADLGDGDDADGLLDGVDLNSTGWNCSAPGSLTDGSPNVYNEPYAQGRFYSATDTIDLTINNDLDAAKIKVSVFCMMPEPYEDAL